VLAEEVRATEERAEATPPDGMRPLRMALAALREDRRTVVVLRHVVGLSLARSRSGLGRSEKLRMRQSAVPVPGLVIAGVDVGGRTPREIKRYAARRLFCILETTGPPNIDLTSSPKPTPSASALDRHGSLSL
jgi:hypothetical protein